MTNSRYRVSLHLSHPTLSAEDAVVSFSQRIRYARSVGRPRVTRQGDLLGGVYAQTDVSLDVSDGVMSDDVRTITECIELAMNSLPLPQVDQIVASGGVCFFLVGVYSEGNILCDLNEVLLAQLARHRMGLKLDFYGGPEVDAPDA